MNRDLTDILAEWPFQSGQLNVRLIEGLDGEPRIQVRLDLGLLQMMVEGRPDGQQPGGYESLLHAAESVIDDLPGPRSITLPDLLGDEASLDDEEAEEADDASDGVAEGDPAATAGATRIGDEADADAEATAPEPEPEPGPMVGEAPEPSDLASEPELGYDGEGPAGPPSDADDPVTLAPDVCRALREEAMQYYHRYVAMLVLEDYEAVVRDTSRNLRVLDVCRDHAERDEDRAELEQFRPYIVMMRARALASLMMQHGEPKAALLAIDQGLEDLRAFFDGAGQGAAYESATEVQMLRGMRDALTPKLPVSQFSELRQRLKEAVSRENYELAAILRDELRLLGEEG